MEQVFDSYEDVSHLWTYVSHFHNVPFYVYSYAFADLVVGSLYGVYQKSTDGFEDKLLDLLRAVRLITTTTYINKIFIISKKNESQLYRNAFNLKIREHHHILKIFTRKKV